MKESDIAYIAGLFDGEGTVGFYRRMETKKIEVNLENLLPIELV